jgi:hypothetical protein
MSMAMAMLARCREAKKCTGIFPMHSIGKKSDDRFTVKLSVLASRLTSMLTGNHDCQ